MSRMRSTLARPGTNFPVGVYLPLPLPPFSLENAQTKLFSRLACAKEEAAELEAPPSGEGHRRKKAKSECQKTPLLRVARIGRWRRWRVFSSFIGLECLCYS